MKNKWILRIAIVAVALICMFAFVGCNKNVDTNKGVQTIEINTAEDFANIANCLGADYNQTTFVLKNDIDLSSIESWTPLGKNYQNAFSGVLDGNGKTIKGLKLYTDVAGNAETSDAEGLFGFTNNATITNLTIDGCNFDLSYASEINYVGGLIAYAYGDTTLRNVSVSGNIVCNLKETNGKYNEATVGDESANTSNITKLYIGGVIGSSTGSIIMDNISSDVNITANTFRKIKYIEEEEILRLHTAFVGGVAGYIRTIDLSETNKAENKITNINASGDISVYAERLNVGGAIGSIYNAPEVKNITINSQNIKVSSVYRANIGGVIGYGDNSIIDNITSNVAKLKFFMDKDASIKVSNIGGTIGYLANQSSLTNGEYSASAVVAIDVKTEFFGGIVGVLCDSKISNCSALGDVKALLSGVSEKNISDVLASNKDISWAGVCGKVFGSTVLHSEHDNIYEISKCNVDMPCINPIFYNDITRVKARKDADGKFVKNDEDNQVFDYYVPSIDEGSITVEQSKIVGLTK